ncbi:hypothetical protein UlMin_041963 [Ulmus minor]
MSLKTRTFPVDQDIILSKTAVNSSFRILYLMNYCPGWADQTCHFFAHLIVNCDEFFQRSGKNKRLTADQVQLLEKSFGVENKLEPEKRVQLAKDKGLQPRQVAIWFQNRRTRWKTMQLEKDYDVLQASYNNLESDFES